MNRIGSILSALLLLLVTTTAFAGPYSSDQSGTATEAAPSSGNCQNKLGNNSYECGVKSSFSAPFGDCFEFSSPGIESSHFDLSTVGLGATLGCSCNPTNGFGNPKFNGSPSSFTCTGTDGSEFFAFTGKVSGANVKGHAAADVGDSFVFSCVKRSTPCF
jgi:hypothetical protein